MKLTSAPYCKHCRFYHGGSRMVCAVHPCGPDSDRCSDYSPKGSGRSKVQISKDRSSRQFNDWKSWRQLLKLGLLLGTLGFSCVLGWLVTHPTAPMTKTITTSEQFK